MRSTNKEPALDIVEASCALATLASLLASAYRPLLGRRGCHVQTTATRGECIPDDRIGEGLYHDTELLVVTDRILCQPIASKHHS